MYVYGFNRAGGQPFASISGEDALDMTGSMVKKAGRK